MVILEQVDKLMEDIKVQEALNKKIVNLRSNIKKNEESHKAEIKKLQEQIAKKEAQFEKANKKILDELEEACNEWNKLHSKTQNNIGQPQTTQEKKEQNKE